MPVKRLCHHYIRAAGKPGEEKMPCRPHETHSACAELFTKNTESCMIRPMPTLRQATKDDIMLIHELAQQAFPATYRDLLSPDQMEYMLDWMYSPASLLRQMEEGHVYFIASLEGERCGYLSVQPEGPGVFHLQKIYVLPGFQGQHIGSYLFRQAIHYIKSIHPAPCQMRLNVNRYNTRAVEFYNRMGMKEVERGDFHIGRGYYMTDYIMGLDIA